MLFFDEILNNGVVTNIQMNLVCIFAIRRHFLYRTLCRIALLSVILPYLLP